MYSLWERSADMPKFPVLEGNKNTDVLIIGGGIAGILCAYMLELEGIDYILVEAENICGGITKNTTAKITVGHGIIYDKLIDNFGVNGARQYLCANQIALDNYFKLCKNIDCHFESTDNYVYSINDKNKLIKGITALKRLGYRAELVSDCSLPFHVLGAVKYRDQAQFNPFEFLSVISQKLNIYEHTRVGEIKGMTAFCKRAKINANRIIVATHFPLINKHGSYFIKMYQHRSYVLALSGAQNVGGMYIDEDEKGLSFRNYGELLLLGGGSHRTGKAGGGFNELRELAKKYYPDAKEEYHFATQDCMTLDGSAYIGRYSARTENMYVATGFNKWGMTASMVAATILRDMLSGKENPYAKVFSPSRTIMRPQLALNVGETVVNFLTPTARRCTHLGCALKWNAQEHTWDCPCHGSRFSEDGSLIDNPATKDL